MKSKIQLAENESKILELKYIGKDDWSRPTYKDQYGRLWKDIDLGYFEPPHLCSVVGNEIDGEPNLPMRQEIKFIFLEKVVIDKEKEFRYMMLGRLRSDCEYYLGNGNRYPGNLQEGNEKKHLDAMKAIWNSFTQEEKPEWLTWEQIKNYEMQMLSD